MSDEAPVLLIVEDDERLATLTQEYLIRNGMEVGIETDEQRVALAAMGCDFAQGYLFSRPMPGADVLRMLEAQAGQE